MHQVDERVTMSEYCLEQCRAVFCIDLLKAQCSGLFGDGQSPMQCSAVECRKEQVSPWSLVSGVVAQGKQYCGVLDLAGMVMLHK